MQSFLSIIFLLFGLSLSSDTCGLNVILTFSKIKCYKIVYQKVGNVFTIMPEMTYSILADRSVAAEESSKKTSKREIFERSHFLGQAFQGGPEVMKIECFKNFEIELYELNNGLRSMRWQRTVSISSLKHLMLHTYFPRSDCDLEEHKVNLEGIHFSFQTINGKQLFFPVFKFLVTPMRKTFERNPVF